ncbi:hypothetical protein RHD99_13275 [Buttiauxella selenatireducens]|uniref:Uncharacterized protein n=1 Tax=Buttiauxella selenatireducens TaxID=3073902 RepID=A0ABY9S551_9ENTR|nr:hypothetical protein [Buttiauxella sp. R73]WMY72459.1 hypothetical protein RHD99_13275 [Buttiauxella sp. R73]
MNFTIHEGLLAGKGDGLMNAIASRNKNVKGHGKGQGSKGKGKG